MSSSAFWYFVVGFAIVVALGMAGRLRNRKRFGSPRRPER